MVVTVDDTRAGFDLSALDLPPRLIAAARSRADQSHLAAEAEDLLRTLPTLPGKATSRRADEAQRQLDPDAVVVAVIRLAEALASAAPDIEVPPAADRIRYGLVPLLRGFGLWDLKRNVEDLALLVETPQRYTAVAAGLDALRDEQAPFIEQVTRTFNEAFRRASLKASAKAVFCGVDGASRRLKALDAGESFARARPTEFFDVYVIVEDGSPYAALAAVHDTAAPVPGTFEDFIAAPRPNGFSALMTRVSLVREHADAASPPAEIAQVIIQTPVMNEVARLGVVHPACARRLAERPRGRPAERFIETLTEGIGTDLAAAVAHEHRIHVFTAGGQSRQHNIHHIAVGASALDLAYKIHTNIGHGARTVRVNGKSASLGTTLRAGDVVSFQTTGYPTGPCARVEDDLELVSTPRAKSLLRRLINRDVDARGRNLLRAYLEGRGILLDRAELDAAATQVRDEYAQWLGDYTVEALYRAVGSQSDDRVSVGRVGASIVEALAPDRHNEPTYPETPTTEWRPVVVAGGATKRLKLCGRCVPVTGDEIVGVRLRRQLTVHTATCVYAQQRSTVAMEWQRVGRSVRSTITLYCEDRPMLIHAVCDRLSRRGSGLDEIEARADEYGRARVHLRVYSQSAVALGDLLAELRTIRSVRTVKLGDSTLSFDERQALESSAWTKARRRLLRDAGPNVSSLIEPPPGSHRRRGPVKLPYNPQKPTYSSAAFFGRDEYVADLLRRVSESSGRFVLVSGPRRIGKTSLALRFADKLPADQRPHVVRVDLRDSKRASSDVVLETIASAVGGIRPSARKSTSRDPARRIAQLVASSDRRVLLVLDEFAAVLESFAAGTLGHRFLAWLRSTMEADSSAGHRLDVVLVSAPECFELLHSPEVEQYLDRLDPVLLEPLDRDAAHAMIVQPLNEQGVSVAASTASDIAALTGGHPYYIIIFLQEVTRLLNATPSKWEITDKDVALCTKRVLDHPLCFHGAVNEPGGRDAQLACLDVIARLGATPTDRVPVGDIAARTRLPHDALEATLQRLVDFRLLDKKVSPGGPDRYRFAIPLVRAWVLRTGRAQLGYRTPSLTAS